MAADTTKRYLHSDCRLYQIAAHAAAVLMPGVQWNRIRITTHGDLAVDRRRARVQLAGETVDITPKEYAVLVALADDPGRAFSRRQLIEAAFGFDADLLDRTVDVHIANLRRKIETDPAKPEHVLTVKGIGYAFADD